MADPNERDGPVDPVDKLTLAWRLIERSFLTRAAMAVHQEGEGICMYSFHFRARSDGSNCSFAFYPRQTPDGKGSLWEDMGQISPNWDQLMTQYDPAIHMVVVVTVPATMDGDPNQTVGSAQMYRRKEYLPVSLGGNLPDQRLAQIQAELETEQRRVQEGLNST